MRHVAASMTAWLLAASVIAAPGQQQESPYEDAVRGLTSRLAEHASMRDAVFAADTRHPPIVLLVEGDAGPATTTVSARSRHHHVNITTLVIEGRIHPDAVAAHHAAWIESEVARMFP